MPKGLMPCQAYDINRNKIYDCDVNKKKTSKVDCLKLTLRVVKSTKSFKLLYITVKSTFDSDYYYFHWRFPLIENPQCVPNRSHVKCLII